jgi:hypothetical protein
MDLKELSPSELLGQGFNLIAALAVTMDKDRLRTSSSGENAVPLLEDLLVKDWDEITMLERVQKEVRRALKLFSSGATWKRTTTFQVGIEPFRYELKQQQSGVDLRMGAFLSTLLAAGEDLRRCARCKKVFVKIMRQEYCSTKCSQDARNETKKRIREEKKAQGK